MADPFMGEIRLFAFNYPPRDWAFCTGATFNPSQYQGLYAVIGNIYGGTPPQSSKLPNMLGQTPIGAGAGPGLTSRALGPVSGNEAVPLSSTQVTAHQHTVTAYAAANLSNAPSATVGLAGTANQFDFSKTNIDPWVTTTGFAASAVSPALGNAVGAANPHENRQPFLNLNFCIALLGKYPVRQ